MQAEFSADVLRQLVDHAPVMMWRAGGEFGCDYFNASWLRFTGRTLAQELGWGWLDGVHADDAERCRRAHEEALRAGRGFEIEYRLRRADGAYRWMLARGAPVADDGAPAGVVGSCTDVTDMRLAHEAAAAELREREAHYREMVEHLPHMPWVADAHGNILAANPRWAERTGRPLDEALGGGWRSAVHPDDRAAVDRAFAEMLASGEAHKVRHRVRMADGNYRWIEAQASPHRDASGRIVRWHGVNTDIHEQVVAETRLRESQAQLATIFDQALVGIALCVAGGGILLANERLCQILGRDMGSLTNLMLSEVTHPDDLAWSLPLFAAHERSGEPYVIERRYLRPDGTAVWCRVHVAFVPRGEGERPLTVTLVEDISQQRTATAEIERLRSTLMRTSRMSAMGAMGAAIAHELNQPLAAVTNYLQAGAQLLRRAEDAAMLAEVLDKAAGQALRAGEIIRRLRSLATKGAVATAPEDLSKLVAATDAVGMVGVDDAGVTCRLELTPGIIVAADRVQLQQVLFNLMRNAVEAVQGRERKELVVSTAVREREALVTVEDSGPGLRPEIRASLFAPFTTSKDGGMGIGLAICKTIVEAHRGAIWAEEGALGGARFCFTLPLADARNGPPRD